MGKMQRIDSSCSYMVLGSQHRPSLAATTNQDRLWARMTIKPLQYPTTASDGHQQYHYQLTYSRDKLVIHRI